MLLGCLQRTLQAQVAQIERVRQQFGEGFSGAGVGREAVKRLADGARRLAGTGAAAVATYACVGGEADQHDAGIVHAPDGPAEKLAHAQVRRVPGIGRCWRWQKGVRR